MLMALFGTGCATTIAAHSPLSTAAVAQVNQAIQGREVRAEFVEEHELASLKPGLKLIEVKEAKIGRDVTEWLEESGSGEARQRSLTTAALRRITVRERGRGALEGLGIGFLTGAILGGLAGAISAASMSPGNIGGCPSIGCSLAFGGVGALVAGASVALLGSPIGALIGHRTTIDFDAPEPGAPSVSAKPGAAVSGPPIGEPKPGASSIAPAWYADGDRHWFFGAGASFLGDSQGAGPGFSLEVEYQALHWGVRAEALRATQPTSSTNPTVTGASVLGTRMFGSSATGPYLGVGFGYLRETGGTTDGGPTAPGHGAAAMAEAGIFFWRGRTWGRASWALRLTVPLFSESLPVVVCTTPVNCSIGGGRTSFAFGSLALRVQL
jgi:hypothetical protein